MKTRKANAKALTATRSPGHKAKGARRHPSTPGPLRRCPRCQPQDRQGVAAPHWLSELQMLAARFAHVGFGPDLAALGLANLYGLYLWLLRHGG